MALEQLNLGNNVVDGETNGGVKTPRLPRWTRQEILVLIQGKRVAEGMVRRRGLAPAPAEPKWASVSSYCRRHGVNRGPVQCRKRWSNLVGDFKKIREWESRNKDDEGEDSTASFWGMRNDVRRERKLPGFFDREVFDILDGGDAPAISSEPPGLTLALEPTATEELTAIFDSGRSAAEEDGLFSDFEPEDAAARPAAGPFPILSVSGKLQERCSTSNHAQGSPEAGKAYGDERRQKRQTTDGEDDRTSSLQNHLIDILERNGKMISAQMEAHNSNVEADREQRKDHGDSLVGVLNKLADAIGRIADRL